ncbi:MAG: Hpt domain-containing protein [Planctomycetia bacterium]|nr:Hpt domain-containing protein [Planctomycetia bacterium]
MKKIIEEYIRNSLEIDEQELIDELVRDYVLLFTQSLANMQKAFEKRDFFALRILAHTLKGSSSNIGAEPVRMVSLQLQDAAEACDEEPCALCVAELEKLSAHLNN